MKTRILITGSSGFVGRQVVKALPLHSTKLRLVVREGVENDAKAKRDDDEVVTTKNLFAESAEWWKIQCTDIDVVVHIAWYVEPGRYLDSPKNLDYLSGSLELAKGAMQAGVKRFVGLGTCFEYDLSGGVLSVETPLKPITPYADAKAALFLSLSHWFPLQSVEFAWCRLFYLYGEGEDSRRLVPYLRSKLEKGERAELTSGKQIRDFLDVADAGRMIAGVVMGDQLGPINVCSGVPITVRQIAEQIADEFGRRDLLVFGARSDNLVDPHCVLGIPNIMLEKVDK
jgi:dTDP-6-deoxy-L-talose 4-dehydrogenase (NAD+)